MKLKKNDTESMEYDAAGDETGRIGNSRFLLFLKDKFRLPSRKEAALRRSATFIEYLRGKGVSIGSGCSFTKPSTQFIDPTNYELITIGDNVTFSLSCAILTHSGECNVLRQLRPGEAFGSLGPVVIGSNVFIGMRTTILKNSSIGDFCVIGAGSVVSGSIPARSVAAGQPAKVIMSIDELLEKYRRREIDEAREYTRILHEKRGRAPQLSDYREFFYLFATAEEAEQAGIDVKHQVGSEYYDLFRQKHKPVYPSFSEFLKDCGLTPE